MAKPKVIKEIDEIQSALEEKVSIDSKNIPNGYAGLDGDGKISLDTLPSNHQYEVELLRALTL